MASKRKLLVVDDDPGMRNQLKWGLDKFDVYTAENRQDALTKFNQLQPQVVTLDLGLPPDANGIQEGLAILEQIIKQAPTTRVVVISGCTEENCSKRAVETGAFEFYPKPVEINKLSEIIDRAYQAFEETEF